MLPETSGKKEKERWRKQPNKIMNKLFENWRKFLTEEKVKGVDGKECWDGYKYAGSEDTDGDGKSDKDKCVPMEEGGQVTQEAKSTAKGKRFAKKVKDPKTGRTRTVNYGQSGKAKDGGDRIRPGTKKGDAYCARSAKIKKCKNPPCANDLSRKKWKCRGDKSVAEELETEEIVG